MIEQLYKCIILEHDYRFLLLAALVCLLSSFTAVSLHQRAIAHIQSKLRWLTLSGVTIGAGIWATHFAAMIAYDAGMPVSYGLLPTIASIVVAIAISGAGFSFATFQRSRKMRALAGAVVGVGIACMHYLGMTGVMLQGYLQYDASYVIVAVGLGILLSMFAFVSMNKTHDPIRFMVAVLSLTLAICALHFISMAGLTVVYDPTVGSVESVISSDLLGAIVAGVTLLLLGLSLSTAFMGQSAALQQSIETARLRSLSDAALEGIVVMDGQGIIQSANHSFILLSGQKPEQINGRPIGDFFRHFKHEGNIASLTATQAYMAETQLIPAGGAPIPAELFFRQMESDRKLSHIVVVRDIREKRAAEQKITYLSNYDALTGLLNRQLFMDRLQHAVRVANDKESKVAILYIDIDGFMELNSIYGTQMGDDILNAVAARLKELVSATATLARIGADQFCIMKENISRTEVLGDVAETLCQRMNTPLELTSGAVPVTVSIGIAVDPIDVDDPGSLLARAEIAMRQAKQVTGNSFRFYEDHFDKIIIKRRQLKRDLSVALQNGEISLVYQPQYDCQESALVGFEALVRWQHPVLGMISPAEFIPLAEESNQIVDIGAWIVEEACKTAASWDRPLTIAINLSPVQFEHADLPDMLESALKRHKLPPTRLELEITEGVLIRDSEMALKILNRMKNMGIQLAMDDFGTGYSSLAYLQQFPFDKLKIDRSFIQAMQSSEHSMNLIRGMIGLAKGLKMPILAEGVETEAQFALLRVEGCNEVQGYYMGKPQPIEYYRALVQQGRVSVSAE